MGMGGRRKMRIKDLPVPVQHQIRIAKQTLQMSDVGARIMGGMNKAEARNILKKYGIRNTES
jgi:hypothetical protein